MSCWQLFPSTSLDKLIKKEDISELFWQEASKLLPSVLAMRGNTERVSRAGKKTIILSANSGRS